MPINKNAVVRYNTLDKCFRNSGRNYFINDLLDAVNKALFEINPNTNGIQIRQLRSDISFMKSTDGYGAPIKNDKNMMGIGFIGIQIVHFQLINPH